jgi:hypothetical protein
MANLIKIPAAVHAHDCGACVHCGSFRDLDSRTQTDVYYCPLDHSLIMRDGSEGPEYSSFSVGLAELVSVQSPDWAFAYDLYERRPQ